MTPGLASGAFSRPAPVRSGGRPAGTPAAISVARSCAGERSGRVRASLIATGRRRRGGDRAAADDGRAAARAGRDLARGRRRDRAWAGRRRTGPARCWARARSVVSASGCSRALGRPKRDLGAGLGLEDASAAASPVMPITGTAARPAEIGGQRPVVARGRRAATARAPTAAAAAACAAGLAPALTITILSRMRVGRAAEDGRVGVGHGAGGLAAVGRVAGEHGGLGELVAVEREARPRGRLGAA